jgi:protein-S-isoprenylcysteine O-methyltransferase Ste14
MFQIKNSLIDIYWTAQPIMPHWIKVLILLMGLVSFVFIILSIKENSRSNSVVGNITVVFLLLLLLIPVSLGVIIPFGDWWPVPRVIAHVSVIIGLLFMVGDLCYARVSTGVLGGATTLARVVMVSAFVLIGNQIFSDQLRINQWDRNMANRIVARLEMSPGFEDMRYLHISGGHWGFPAGLRTVMGDMNISAFSPSYSKFNIISDGSGYRFERAGGIKAEQGEAYCLGRLSWPHLESTTLIGDLGVVCLKKP